MIAIRINLTYGTVLSLISKADTGLDKLARHVGGAKFSAVAGDARLR